jgi:Alpha/beta hydrolase domain
MRSDSVSRPHRRHVTVLVGVALLAVALPLAVAARVGRAAASAANPTVSGPVTGGLGAIVPPNLNEFDLAQVGYQQSEFFLTGTANAYSPTAPLTTDGKWTVAPGTAPTSPPAPYTTRVVVYRPIDPKKFNGTVVVEWLNVSGGLDADPDWTQTHNELIRDGFAWVGVSAQAQGVNQLKCSATAPPSLQCPAPGDPGRYGTLVHPGDSYSYDIFSQAGQAIRDDSAQILGGLAPRTLLAAGESQSAARMVTYIDAVQPLVHVYNGFLVHSRGASGAALSQSPLASVPAPNPTLIRTDLGVPVFVFQTEFDISGAYTARQPDTNLFRQWEAAGTSHFDTYGLLIGPSDTGNGQGAVANLEAMQNPTNIPGPGGQCTLPINTGGAHWLLDSAIYWLNQWATKGIPPPHGQPLQIASTSPFAYAKDANGNTIGGVRSPQVDAPIAVLAGVGNTAANSAPISQFCFLFGSTVPYTPAHLAALYPTHLQFVFKWDVATLKDVLHGFILPADAIELANAAAASQIGK